MYMSIILIIDLAIIHLINCFLYIYIVSSCLINRNIITTPISIKFNYFRISCVLVQTVPIAIIKSVSLQYAAITEQTCRYWYNITPITFQIYVLCGQETGIYTIFNQSQGNLHGRPTFGILLTRSRCLVRPKPEQFLSVEQIYGHWRKCVIL